MRTIHHFSTLKLSFSQASSSKKLHTSAINVTCIIYDSFSRKIYNSRISRDDIVIYLDRIVFITRRRVAVVRRRETVVSPLCKILYLKSHLLVAFQIPSWNLHVVFECDYVTFGRHRNDFCC